MDQHRCPFCCLEKCRIILENDAALAFPDAFPVAEGHLLVIPRRHVASLFDLSEEEQAALWRLVALARGSLMSELCPRPEIGHPNRPPAPGGRDRRMWGRMNTVQAKRTGPTLPVPAAVVSAPGRAATASPSARREGACAGVWEDSEVWPGA
jgi:hypothetical protein